MNAEAERCGAPKTQGPELLLCTLEPGHDEGDDGTWHEVTVTDRRQMDFGTARIEVRTEETITWQPLRESLAASLRARPS